MAKSKMMIRCPKCGRENYITFVSINVCCWCGWDDTDKKYLPKDTNISELDKQRNGKRSDDENR